MLNPPSDCLQNAHGGDNGSPMWLPLLVHPQSKPSLPLEYSGSNQINARCWFCICHFLCLEVCPSASLKFSQLRCSWLNPWHLRDTTLLLFLDLFQDSWLSHQQRRQSLDFLDCAFISSACQGYKCNKTDTCVQWAISSSTTSASKAS